MDALGNWTGLTTVSAGTTTSQSRGHNAQNEIGSITGDTSSTPGYDAAGNTVADDAGHRLVYDAWDRLVKVTNLDGTVTLAVYAYDGLGRRVGETHGAITTDLYYSSAWQVLEERQSGMGPTQYVWSPAGVDTLVLRDRYALDGTTLVERLYAQQDANGNVTAVVDGRPGSPTLGQVLERYAEDPYGLATALNPTTWAALAVSAYGWVYLHQGLRYDGAVGLYDQRGRVYSPTLGRPMQVDPTGFGGGDTNLYRTEGDGPVGRLDPSGLASLKELDLPGNKAQLNYRKNWLRRQAGDGYGVDVGVLDRNTGKVNRGGKVVALEKVKEAADAYDGPETEDDWAKWFDSNNELKPSIDDDLMKWNLDGLRASGDRSLTRPGWDWEREEVQRKCERMAEADVQWMASGGMFVRPSMPVGRIGSPMGTVQGNAPTTIAGRPYTGHAIDQMQARGIPPSVVENTIQHGVPGRPQPVGSGTASHYESVNNITVITDAASGRVVTVFPGR